MKNDRNVFGKRLAIALQRTGISQRDLARRCDLSEVSVSRYIHGERRPDTDMLREIAVVTGVTSDWLIGVDETQPFVISKDDVTSIRKPMLLWVEARFARKPFPVECCGIRNVKLHGDNDKTTMVCFTGGMNRADTYGSLWRMWSLKPTVDQMMLTKWSDEA